MLQAHGPLPLTPTLSDEPVQVSDHSVQRQVWAFTVSMTLGVTYISYVLEARKSQEKRLKVHFA